MKLLKKDIMEERDYQRNIFLAASQKNTLCVLPTGLGKTNIAIMLAAYRLEKFPESKILVSAPTRPLVNQHYRSFLRALEIDENKMCVLTGVIPSKKRGEMYKEKKIIFATPQVIENDIKSGILSLREFSLLVIDEAHHSIGGYAYPYIAKHYLKTAENPRILGLTASPGGEAEKIKEICKNLGIDAVEIRTEQDKDVEPWVKTKKIEFTEVELPESFLKIKKLIEDAYKERIEKLKKMGLIRKTRISKKELLSLQINLQKAIKEGYKKAFAGSSMVAQAIKLEHALTLLETQTIGVLEKYWKKLRDDKSNAAKSVIKDAKVSNAMWLTRGLYEKGSKHPKISKLCSIVHQQFQNKPDSKIIIFANFRDTVKEIVLSLKSVDNAKPVEFLGQKEGITQKEQIKRLEEFKEGKYNVLVCTSVGEEGLDIPEMDLAVFYEAVPSEIRAIQRRGRVGRQKAGRIVFLITKKTRDKAYLWSAYQKEKKMRKVLYGMKERLQKELKDFST